MTYFCPPLYYAIKNLQYNAAKLLIDNGANVNMLIVDMDCPSKGCAYVNNCGDYHDVCLLHVAVSYDDTDMVRLLLDSGAKISYECPNGLLSPIAICNRNYSMLDLLYERDIGIGRAFDIRLEKENRYGEWHYYTEEWCDLELVLDIGDIDMVMIVAKHLDQHMKDIMLAVAYDMEVDVSIIERLLQLGASGSKIIEKAIYHKSIYDLIRND